MTVRVLQGDCLAVLPTLPARHFHCCVTSPPYFGLRSYLPEGHPDKALEIGGEATPDEFVARLVGVFREVWRVLRDDGVCFVNIGDSYNGGGLGGGASKGASLVGSSNRDRQTDVRKTTKIENIKPKDLIGIPWMLAFALRADGWYLRQANIWAKRSCMPESVRDRCTRAHEDIFMFTKRARYFYDAVAIEEDGDVPAGTRAAKGASVRSEIDGVNGRPPEYWEYTGKRNKRSVWWMTSRPFAQAHFATFPPELPEICIKAGTSERGCCPACGAPWVRDVERVGMEIKRSGRADAMGEHGRTATSGTMTRPPSNRTIGWAPICACPEAPPAPCRVLDCFGGSGTTGLVADRLGRDCTLIDLSGEYQEMQRARITADAPLFASVAP